MDIFDDRRCELGEGALWHPERDQLFWFDILHGALLSRDGEPSGAGSSASSPRPPAGSTATICSSPPRPRSGASTSPPAPRSRCCRSPPTRPSFARTTAAPIPGAASGSARWRKAGKAPRQHLALLEGRAARALSRHHHPQRHLLRRRPRARLFRRHPAGKVWAQPLDPATGWPKGEPRLFLEDKSPDGAVTDAEGRIWIARWGGGRVTCHAPDGRLRRRGALPRIAAHLPRLRRRRPRHPLRHLGAAGHERGRAAGRARRPA